MKTRAVGITTGLLAVILLVPALAQDEPKQQQCEEPYDQLDEARLNVEILTIELDAQKDKLRQFVAGFGGGVAIIDMPPIPEEAEKERQKAIAALRERYEQLKAAILETGKKLRRERRRVAELEERLGEPPSPESHPDLNRRLRDVEQKLDRVLKELEGLKGR